MTSGSITIDNFQIAYLEANTHAKNILFFIHGNSGSSRTWIKQLSDPLLRDYRVIAFDLPAHGDSPSSENPDSDYSLPVMGKLIAGAVNKLSSGNAFIQVGFSLGSNVLAEALPWIKPAGIVLTGSSVGGEGYTMDKIFQPGTDSSMLFSDTAPVESVASLAVNMSYNATDDDKRIVIEDYNRVKAGFRPAFIKTVMEGKTSDEVVLIKQTGLPVLVVFGREDRFANPDYLNDAPFNLWNNKVFQLPEAGHVAHIDQASAFNKLLADYSREILK